VKFLMLARLTLALFGGMVIYLLPAEGQPAASTSELHVADITEHAQTIDIKHWHGGLLRVMSVPQKGSGRAGGLTVLDTKLEGFLYPIKVQTCCLMVNIHSSNTVVFSIYACSQL
jgi:hypothetical protein